MYYWLRKIHSLLGVIPLGVFLFFHLLINLLVVKGEKTFRSYHSLAQSMPYLKIWEIALIWIPLGLHVVLGIYLIYLGKMSLSHHGRRVPHYLYLFQRISGVLALGFILYHSFAMGVFSLSSPPPGYFWERLQSDLSQPLYLAIYITGLIAVIFHFCYGFWTFLIHWGLTVSRRARLFSAIFCLALGIFMTALGFLIIYTFYQMGTQL